MGTIPKKNANDARASHPEPNHFPPGKEPVEMAMFSAPRKHRGRAGQRKVDGERQRAPCRARAHAGLAGLQGDEPDVGQHAQGGPHGPETHHGSQGVQDEVVHVEQAVGVLVKAQSPVSCVVSNDSVTRKPMSSVCRQVRRK